MEKRTPGAPLSEAEHKQRVDAAKARWEGAAAAAGSAAGAAGAGAAVGLLGRRGAARTYHAGLAEADGIRGRAQDRAMRIEAAGAKEARVSGAGDVVPKYRGFLARRIREVGRDQRAVMTGEGVSPPIHRNRADVLLGATDLADIDLADQVPTGKDLWSGALDRQRADMEAAAERLKNVGRIKRVPIKGFVRGGASPHVRLTRGRVKALDGAALAGMSDAEIAADPKLRAARKAVREARGAASGPVDTSKLPPGARQRVLRAVDDMAAIEADFRDGGDEASDWLMSRKGRAGIRRTRAVLAQHGLLPKGHFSEQLLTGGGGKAAPRARKKPVAVGQGSATVVKPTTRRVPRPWPTKDDATAFRQQMRRDAMDRAAHQQALVVRRAEPRAAAAVVRGVLGAQRALEAIPAAQWRARLIGGAAGAALGGLGSYGIARHRKSNLVEKRAEDATAAEPWALGPHGFGRWGKSNLVEQLAKAAPLGGDVTGDVTPPSSADSLAQRLAAMFRAWTVNPATAGEGIAEAITPAENAFIAASASIIAPPPGDSTQRAPTGPDNSYVLTGAFDARNPRVEQLLSRYSFDLIRAISEQSREAIRTALQLGAMTGASIPEQARLVRQSVGLAPGQVAWVASYRAQLASGDVRALSRELRDRRFDGPIRRAVETGQPLSAEQIDRYADAYHRRTLAYRATTIARTEGIRAANMGSVAQVKAMLESDPNLTVEKTWMATKTDDLTREAHVHLDGQVVVGMDALFTVRGPHGETLTIRYPHDEMAAAEMTINCILPGTRVAADGVAAVSSRFFEGYAVRIRTAGGLEVSVTPNHPIMTSRGWEAAQFIEKGQHLARVAEWDRIVQVDDQHAPPRIEEVEHALRAGGTLRKVAAVVGFHGERMQGDVDVVFAGGHLPDRGEAGPCEDGDDVGLGLRRLHERLLLQSCPRDHFDGSPRAAGSDVGGLNLSLPEILRHLAPLEPLSFAASPLSDAVFSQHPDDAGARHFMPPGHSIDREAAPVIRDEVLDVGRCPPAPLLAETRGPDQAAFCQQAVSGVDPGASFSARLRHGEALGIELDEVVSVERFWCRTHVYNLETKSHLYVGDGLIHHNCRCTCAFRIIRARSSLFAEAL